MGSISRILDLYGYIILLYIILSWIVTSGGPQWARDLYRGLAPICEPYLGLFRRLLPPIRVGGGGLDLSPVIALVVLRFVADATARF